MFSHRQAGNGSANLKIRAPLKNAIEKRNIIGLSENI